jgi:hypothetical protein
MSSGISDFRRVLARALLISKITACQPEFEQEKGE